jgi:phage terminase large subunit
MMDIYFHFLTKMIAPDYIAPEDLEHFVGLSTSTAQHPVPADSSVDAKSSTSTGQHKNNEIPSESSILPRVDKPTSSYPGDYKEEEIVPEEGFKTISEFSTLNFPSPAFLVSFFNQDIADGAVTLHPWQVSVSQDLVPVEKPTAQHPLKYCLVAANGSGKDAFIVAPFAIWFTLTKKRARVIITSSSGTQLTAQTESYIKDLAERVNAFFQREVFKIRQRYIYCKLSGSEIRMFATDEEGKAEGYHPIEPNAEMAIIVNEGKSVSEDIHKALRRCSGYNYWLEVSSPGEPTGDLYYAFNNWKWTKRITSFDCTHISEDERLEDKQRYGEHSAYYRSKHLALFTTISGQVIIPVEVIDRLLLMPPRLTFSATKWHKRFGIDLSAGGDELVISVTYQNKLVEEYTWRERDTTVSADKIHSFLLKHKLSFDYDYIWADDGGVGHAIIDMLVRKGWVNIHRIHNQSPAYNRKHFGNRGAESYDRVKRLFEENIFDPTGLSKECIEQLTNRKVKDRLDGSKVFLQSKKEAKAHGFPSPDRADAFILSLTGLTLEDFTEDMAEQKNPVINKPRFTSAEIEQHYEDTYTFGNFDESKRIPTEKRAYGSLAVAIAGNNEDDEITFDGNDNQNN